MFFIQTDSVKLYFEEVDIIHGCNSIAVNVSTRLLRNNMQ